MNSGIIRNKREVFLKYKEIRNQKNNRFQSVHYQQNQSLSANSNPRKPLINVQMTKVQLPPIWVDRYQQCSYLIKEVEQLRRKMATEQSRSLTCVKQSEAKSIQTRIYNYASEAAKKIRKCESLLNAIQDDSIHQNSLYKDTCEGIRIKLATQIQQKTRELRAQQKAFVEYKKQIDKTTKVSFLQLAAQKMLEDPYQQNLQQQEEEIIDLQRNQELQKIISSIIELNSIYKELNCLVILQGSLVDRIDMNISQAQEKVSVGVETLGRAETKQKFGSKVACIVMIVLFCLIMIAGIILLAKNR